MKKYKKAISLLFLFGFLLQSFLVKTVKADDLQNNIILLIDNSGSMKQTDPKRLSLVAASMLIDSINDNTKLNIIPFGDKPTALYSIVNSPSKENLKAELLNIKFDNNYTDVKEGLKEALTQLSKVQGDKSVIVLSDGKEDPLGGITNQHKEEFASLIEKAHSEGIKINCIGLSEGADKESLANIAFKTGGEFYYSNNPSDLFNVFSKLLSSINDFYTVQEYAVEDGASKEVKLSSYIQEVTIKIASFDSKTPLVSVEENNKELTASKLGEGYKIYSFKNEEDKTINILPRDKGKYSIIVQVKSKAKLTINSTDKNFTVPNGVPMDINISLAIDKNIMGLHMDKLEGDSREIINKKGDSFSFTFNKDKSGQYSMLITAYDGDGRIIAVNDLNINVTDYPPFYYANLLPSEMILDRPYKIELKELSSLKVSNISGEIIVDYGDKYEEFPLKYVDNILSTEVTLHKLQEVKLTTCINGISDKESFSYYLPYSKVKAIEKPFIEIEAVQTKSYIKQNAKAKVNFNIKASKLYKEEKIFVFDTNNNKLGEFTVSDRNSSKANSSSQVSVTIAARTLGRDIVLVLKPEEDIKVTNRINTRITVLSKFRYYYEPFKIPIYILLTLAILLYAFSRFVKYQYKKFYNYSLTKELTYKVSSSANNYFLSITLSPEENLQYLNLKGKSLAVEEVSSNEIGYFIMNLPKGSKLIKALKYFLFKEKVFLIEYYRTMEQQVYKEDEEIEGSLEYERDIKIVIKNKKEEISIYFS